jgi:DNA-binding MarR family transcriptional regulator/N-acetylglutamate synthase-like GNAT family acetyltransferase
MNFDRMETLRHLSRKLVRELGILQLNQPNVQETPGHWHALIEISKDPGITILKLGHLLVMSSSTVSRLIKSLVKKRLVVLIAGEDKREKSLHLTASGQMAVKKIDVFSHDKIKGALEFLSPADLAELIKSIGKYADALERSRRLKEQTKVNTLSTSRQLRTQIASMITTIQKDEFSIPISENINECILKAEQHFYYNNSYNFWYATDAEGEVIGSIGLKRINDTEAEIKKFFVIHAYRGKGVGQKLMRTLLKASIKHGFHFLYLGTVDKLEAAQKFYKKYGFVQIGTEELPSLFEKCPVDSFFFQGNPTQIIKKMDSL